MINLLRASTHKYLKVRGSENADNPVKSNLFQDDMSITST